MERSNGAGPALDTGPREALEGVLYEIKRVIVGQVHGQALAPQPTLERPSNPALVFGHENAHESRLGARF